MLGGLPRLKRELGKALTPFVPLSLCCPEGLHVRLGKAARGSSRTVSAIPGQGSLQDLIRKAEGFLQTPLSCSHPTHPRRPAGEAVFLPLSALPQVPQLRAHTGSPVVLVSHEALPHVLLVEALGRGDGTCCPVDHDVGQQVIQGELPGKAEPEATPSARCSCTTSKSCHFQAAPICQAPCPPGFLPQTSLRGQGCRPHATGRAG